MQRKTPEGKVSFKYSFKVKSEEIDALNHVNNVVYLQWIQDVATLHWNSLANGEIRNQSAWVALRHEIDYVSPAYLNDMITIYTWIEETKGVKSVRMVSIYRGDTLLVKAKTVWVLLDAKTLKPKRVGADILAMFSK